VCSVSHQSHTQSLHIAHVSLSLSRPLPVRSQHPERSNGQASWPGPLCRRRSPGDGPNLKGISCGILSWAGPLLGPHSSGNRRCGASLSLVAPPLAPHPDHRARCCAAAAVLGPLVGVRRGIVPPGWNQLPEATRTSSPVCLTQSVSQSASRVPVSCVGWGVGARPGRARTPHTPPAHGPSPRLVLAWLWWGRSTEFWSERMRPSRERADVRPRPGRKLATNHPGA
jgi:hypothetical protein